MSLICTQYFVILKDDLILISNLGNSSETITSNIWPFQLKAASLDDGADRKGRRWGQVSQYIF